MSSPKVVITFACLYSHTIRIWINSLVPEWPCIIEPYLEYIRDFEQWSSTLFVNFGPPTTTVCYLNMCSFNGDRIISKIKILCNLIWKICSTTQIYTDDPALAEAYTITNTQANFRAESIKWFIEDQAFCRSHDVAPPPTPYPPLRQ